MNSIKTIKNKHRIIGDLIIISSVIFIISLILFTYYNRYRYDYVFYLQLDRSLNTESVNFLLLRCICVPAFICNVIRNKIKQYEGEVHIAVKRSYVLSVLSIVISSLAYFTVFLAEKHNPWGGFLSWTFHSDLVIIFLVLLAVISFLILAYSIVSVVKYKSKQENIKYFYFNLCIILNIVNILETSILLFIVAIFG